MHTSKNKHLDKIDSYEKASYVHFPRFLQDFFKYADTIWMGVNPNMKLKKVS